MKLSIIERIWLLGILPNEGDLTTLKIVRDLRGDLSFSEQEHADFELATDGTQITWNPDKDTQRDIPIGPKAQAIILEAFDNLEKQKKMKLEWLDLYERFHEEK